MRRRWQQRLEPWLRRGSPAQPRLPGLRAARRPSSAGSAAPAQQSAVVLVGASDKLNRDLRARVGRSGGTGPGLAAAASFPPADGNRGPAMTHWRRGRAQRSRSRRSSRCSPMRSWDERRVVVPWARPGPPEAVMWGLVTIMRDDRGPAPRLVRDLRRGLRVGRRTSRGCWCRSGRTSPRRCRRTQGFATLAADLADRFARDPASLRQALAEHGVPGAADHRARRSLLLTFPPRQPRCRPGSRERERDHAPRPPTPPRRRRRAPPSDDAARRHHRQRARPAASAWRHVSLAGRRQPCQRRPPRAGGVALMCPICLGDIPDWAPWTTGAGIRAGRTTRGSISR